jgi:hemerythrin
VDEFSKQGASQDLVDKVAEMAQNWLINHISEVDRHYAKYIEDRVQNKGKGIL